MPVTRHDLIMRAKDAVHLIKWYCSRSEFRKRECMRRGGFQSLVSDVWLRMLDQFEKLSVVNCKFSTFVVNNCKWECSKAYLRGRSKRGGSKVDFYFKLLRAVPDIPEANLCVYEDLAESTHWKEAVSAAMRLLSERERRIVEGVYGIDGQPRTLQSIGDEFGITRERVRQIANEAVRKCKSHPLLEKYRENHALQLENSLEELEDDEYWC